jgi:hypothetical protein
MNEEPKKRGRPTGWRKKGATGRIKQFTSLTIAGTEEEIAALKKAAKEAGKSVSRFILDNYSK